MNRQKLFGILASFVLAVVGAGLLVAFVRGAEQRALKGEEAVNVLVVTEVVPKGTKAEAMAAKVKTEAVPAKVAAKGAVGDLASVADKVTAVELVPGEQVVQSRFAAANEVGQAVVPPGSLKVTVALDVVRAMGGNVRDGDSVGVMASFDDPAVTRLIVQKAPVTDVRTEAGLRVISDATGPAPVGKLLVTLAVDAPAAERLVFAAEHGRIWLADESPAADQAGSRLLTSAALTELGPVTGTGPPLSREDVR